MADKQKPRTSYEVIKRWREKAYKQITLQLRYDTDGEILQFIEDNKAEHGVTPLFREAMKLLMKEWNK